MNRIVVLGGKGFIGGRIAADLAAGGFAVESVGRAECDLLDSRQVERLASSWDPSTAVIVCAGVARRLEDSASAAEANAKICRNVAAVMSAGGLGSVLFLSSSAVYDGLRAGGLISEGTSALPADSYGDSKLWCEQIFVQSCSACKIPLLILRPTIVFGRGDRSRSLIGRWKHSLIQGQEIEVVGDGQNRIDVIPVEDLIFVAGTWIRKPFDALVNVASGQSMTVHQIIDRLASSMGCVPLVRETPERPRPADRDFDLARLREWFPSLRSANILEAIRRYALE